MGFETVNLHRPTQPLRPSASAAAATAAGSARDAAPPAAAASAIRSDAARRSIEVSVKACMKPFYVGCLSQGGQGESRKEYRPSLSSSKYMGFHQHKPLSL
jgi:hypothetical protein